MGIKDKIFGKVLDKMLGNVNINDIQKNVKDGKYDVNKMIGLVEKMIGKKASDNLIQQIQAKVNNGEKISFNSILDIMKEMDMSKVKENSQNGTVNLKEMQDVLSDIVGNEKSEELLNTAKEVADELDDDENK